MYKVEIKYVMPFSSFYSGWKWFIMYKDREMGSSSYCYSSYGAAERAFKRLMSDDVREQLVQK